MTGVRRFGAAAAGAVLTFAMVCMVGAPAAHADDVTFQFQAAAQAPVAQITEDEPGATFHPEGEGEYNYAEADLSAAGGHALGTPFWPGSAAGNAGTLAQVLGAPDAASVLNYPA